MVRSPLGPPSRFLLAAVAVLLVNARISLRGADASLILLHQRLVHVILGIAVAVMVLLASAPRRRAACGRACCC